MTRQMPPGHGAATFTGTSATMAAVSAGQLLIVAAAGLFAGCVNTIAGGGSLVSFPILVALGLTPLQANVTNTVGITPAALGGALGYRRELRTQPQRLLRLGIACVIGAAAGAAVLLTTPQRAFAAVVPLLIVAACALLLFQRRLVRLVGERGGERSAGLFLGVLVCAIYGGYFGAAMSIVILALLALQVRDSLQHLNAAKVVLAGAVNFVAAAGFALFGPVRWEAAAVLAVASLLGGRVGATLARRIPETGLRWVVVIYGLAAAVWLALRG